MPRQGPFWDFWGLDHDQNERVTDVITDKLGFGKGDPGNILRPIPSPPLWLCSFKPTPVMWIRKWRKNTGPGVRGLVLGLVLVLPVTHGGNRGTVYPSIKWTWSL